MASKHQLALRAARAAASIRSRQGIEPTSSACPFDIAERLGLIVRLVRLPSLEGLLFPGKPATIVLNAERPSGRIRHTCAHEVGHFVFGHGARLDEIASQKQPRWQPQEFVADRFASALLMPKLTVASALMRREWSPLDLTSAQTFTIAQDLGVGYRNLIGNLERTLRMMTPAVAEQLRRAGRH